MGNHATVALILTSIAKRSVSKDEGGSRMMERTGAPRPVADANLVLRDASLCSALRYEGRWVAAMALFACLLSPLAAQEQALAPLTPRARIALPGVYGRIDHYGFDTRRGRLFVSALGNDTVEVIDQWRRVYSITGLEHPQATQYIPGLDRIAVSSQSGKLRFYEAGNYAQKGVLDLGQNADNMRYDEAAKLLYVGHGEDTRGAVSAVDPATMQAKREYKLGSHPESIQLETLGTRFYVNLPDQEAIASVDRATGAVTKWRLPGHVNSHAMAFDAETRRLFVADLQPGRLKVINADTGEVVASLPCAPGVDDLWFDARRKRIYATGAGMVDVFARDGAGAWSRMARVFVDGASGTSVHLRTRTQDALYLSRPNMLPSGGSEVLIHYVND